MTVRSKNGAPAASTVRRTPPTVPVTRAARATFARLGQLAVALSVTAAAGSASAMNIVPTNDAQALVQALTGQGINVLSVTLSPGVDFSDGQGSSPPTGTYTEGPLGLPDGILLTSGTARNAAPPNDQTGITGTSPYGDDALCHQVAGVNTTDASKLTIQFTLDPDADGIAFDWLFGSEEYPEYVGSFNDSVGVFIHSDTGSGFGPQLNIALDQGNNPVTINGPFFSGPTVIIPSAQQPVTEYDGTTPHLTTTRTLPNGPNVVHEITIVVCDALDHSLDSGVLIGALRACNGVCPNAVAFCGDGVVNGSEDCDDGNNNNVDGCSNTCQGPDSDGDGLSDIREAILGTNPANPDSDGDTIADGQEVGGDLVNPVDTNADGIIDALDPCVPLALYCDPDGDGISGTVEIQLGTDPLSADTDGDGLDDAIEIGNPLTPNDSDGDGVIDALESAILDVDGDGAPDQTDPEDANPCVPNLGAGGCDQDNDGLTNSEEIALGSNPTKKDSDGDGLGDGIEVGGNIESPLDSDGDGIPDVLESSVADSDGDGTPNQNDATNANPCEPNLQAGTCDQDGDGLTNNQEIALGTDPTDADTDDDGALDGQEMNPGLDSDGDGSINALDPDSDNDGLFDGTELGFDCSNPDTDLGAGHCVADADGGTTKTNPTKADTDGGGALDGSEDPNHNGAVDPGESNPAGSGDDGAIVDTDGDGVSDQVEIQLDSNPTDGDSDDDGVLDGLEVNPNLDTDGDGLINLLDPDSDNDGLFDGTELGKNCALGDTDLSKGTCIADADGGATKTNPTKADTDGGGKSDGSEDANHDGAIDAGETDPTVGHGADDVNVIDTDQDGLSDAEEIFIGSDPFDDDSDDDGVKDGDEINPSVDTDGDGLTNANDPDSDGDGIYDGTEMGLGCLVNGAVHCVPDGDGGATQTSTLLPDSDGGGVKDGAEDKNHNGIVDPGETDPNDPTDDVCLQSSECALTGQVCDAVTQKCVDAKCDASTPCPAPDACHFAGVCDPASGTCAYANRSDGSMCSDDNVCTADACFAGVCVSASVLDTTPCTEDGKDGLCIAGHCLTDSGVGGAGTGGSGGTTTTTTTNSGGSGEGGASATGGSGGDGGGGASATGPTGNQDKSYSIFGGGCSSSPNGRENSGGLAFGALALAYAISRRRRG
ncbi:MAG: choice-of-anchor L domain-containing protein [Polyangiaceae bacterium]